jgi:hypothetical protein
MIKKQTKFFNKYFKIFLKWIFGFDFDLKKHNGIEIESYPEKKWFLVPFPAQKGNPFNDDNLATVNRHSFLEDEKFIKSKTLAEARWRTHADETVRNISWRLHTAIWAVSVGLKNIEIENEIFVECGTGKGYMAAGIFEYLKWDEKKPIFFLIDSFKSTMPDDRGVQSDNGQKLFVYADGDKEVRDYFSIYPRVEIVKGIIPMILNDLPEQSVIKFLHLDLNSHVAEEQALEYLTNRFTTGSVILFDDYGGPGGEKQAEMHEKFASKNNKSLLCLPTGQALIIW